MHIPIFRGHHDIPGTPYLIIDKNQSLQKFQGQFSALLLNFCHKKQEIFLAALLTIDQQRICKGWKHMRIFQITDLARSLRSLSMTAGLNSGQSHVSQCVSRN